VSERTPLLEEPAVNVRQRLGTTCNRFILEEQRHHPQATGELSEILTQIVLAAKVVSREVRKAGLIEILGKTGTKNVQGEEVTKLDVYANEQFVNALSHDCFISIIASEENDEVIQAERPTNRRPGKYAIALDPLDGSSNIDVNVSIGTVWSIQKRVSEGREGQASDLLQSGNHQVAAGYVLYGSSTMLVYSAGDGVHGFTLDPSVGEFLLSHENIRLPENGAIYSVNEGNTAFWTDGTRNWVQSLKGKSNPAGKPYSLRYVGSMVADVHRTLLVGGIFAYPPDSKSSPKLRGKLRLLYEASPMAFLVEQAGGRASTGKQRILDLEPEWLHQRVPVFFGSVRDVEFAESFQEDLA
jgi:fructose-1,6-bisphosphatase I